MRLLFTGGGGAGNEAIFRFLGDQYELYFADAVLEQIAPLSYQESYDNSGLLTGNPENEVHGVLISLDCIEEIIDEAIDMKCNLIIAHHPIIFNGIKKLTGSNYIERTIINAIKNDIAIFHLTCFFINKNLNTFARYFKIICFKEKTKNFFCGVS